MAGDNRTEAATPKRRDDARKEGQVARSVEINSAIALIAGFATLMLWGPKMKEILGDDMVQRLNAAGLAKSGDVSVPFLFETFTSMGILLTKALWPIFLVMIVSGVAANLLQVKFRVTPEVLKPRGNRINPISGFKQRFGPASLVELGKSILKVAVVGIPAALVVWQARYDLMELMAISPAGIAAVVATLVAKVGLTVGGIFIVVAILDYIWQRHRFEKSIRMTKTEVKQEQRQMDMSPEMKAQQRRRQREAARKRMLAAVPTADVVITNPTHYSVALRYDADDGAPRVVAKGVDLLALRIREIAKEHDVAMVENRPLARALYAQVEVGMVIPPDMFAAVAEVLAFVFRANRQRGQDWQSQRRLEHA